MDTAFASAARPTTPGRRRAYRLVALLLAVTAALALAMAAPAGATEATGGEGEESGKLTISDNPHDQFGLVLFGLMGLGALAAGVNAVRQLRGERPKADGKIRWR